MIYINVNGYIGSVNFANKNGRFHRIGGPAVINENFQSWWENGNRHRLDGPAVIHGNIIEYWIEYEKYTESEYHKKLKEMGFFYDKN